MFVLLKNSNTLSKLRITYYSLRVLIAIMFVTGVALSDYGNFTNYNKGTV